MDQNFSETLQIQEPGPSTVEEGAGRAYVYMKLESRNSHNDEWWKMVNSHTRKKVHAPPDNLYFQNRFTGPVVDEKSVWWVSLSHLRSLEGKGE